MPGSNNNKASRNKQMNNGKTSTATSGNKRHIDDNNSGTKDSVPQSKKHRTTQLKGQF